MAMPSATPIIELVERLEPGMTNGELRDQLERGHAAAFGWALACCRGNKEEAEDVLHDSYLTVLKGDAQFAARSNFQTWLFGIIRLKALASRRKNWWRALVLERKNGLLHHNPVLAPDSEVEMESRNQLLRESLSKLPGRQHQVVHLVFYQEMTIEEAAAVMGISIGTARTHYTRGKEKLAKILSGVAQQRNGNWRDEL